MEPNRMAYYSSPFSERYGTASMQALMSTGWIRNRWRRSWLEILEEQSRQGAITLTGEQAGYLVDLLSKPLPEYTDADYVKAKAREQVTHHDLVAELDVFTESLAVRLPLHVACTSSDIEDMAEYLRMELAGDLLMRQLLMCLDQLSRVVVVQASTLCLGRTHLRPAEPTTFGYRLAVDLAELQEAVSWFQDCLDLSYEKGTGGAVGTRAGLQMLGIQNGWLYGDMWPVGQTVGRFHELRLTSCLSGIAAVLYRSAFNLRLLQGQGLVFEGQLEGQVGSSAIPGKSNPITAERICSLCRLVPTRGQDVWGYAAHSLLERTLDDSASRRSVVPELWILMSQVATDYFTLLRNLITMQVSMEQEVWDNWRAWVPARLQTGSLRAGWTREQAASWGRRAVSDSISLEAMLDLPHPACMDLKVKGREGLLWLDWAVKSARDTAARAQDFVREAMERIQKMERILPLQDGG